MKSKEKFFEQIYYQSKDKIYRLCLAFMGNEYDAKDLFQEIMLKVWKNLHSFRGEANINTWIYRIAVNTALQTINKIEKNKQRELNFGSTFYESNKNNYQIEQLYKAISSLKVLDRLIISLFLEGCSYQEIANITGLSVSNVGVKIHRIKNLLKQKLNNYEQGNNTMAKNMEKAKS